MAKMKMPDIEQLALIRQRIDEYLAAHPTNSGDYKPSFTNFDRKLRTGIVFYSSGWGWRVRKNWEEVWQSKYDHALSNNPVGADRPTGGKSQGSF